MAKLGYIIRTKRAKAGVWPAFPIIMAAVGGGSITQATYYAIKTAQFNEAGLLWLFGVLFLGVSALYQRWVWKR